jgi:hydroxyacylglutathione hydrolase
MYNIIPGAKIIYGRNLSQVKGGKKLLIDVLEVGAFAANCYLVGCPETKKALVIDPGAEGQRINRRLDRLGLSVVYIVNTHGHVDHVGANSEVREKTSAPLLIHENDASMFRSPQASLMLFVGSKGKLSPPDRTVKEGDRLEVGTLSFEILETPGHTRGGICLLSDGVLFTGDTLFAGSIGRTDLPGGDFKQLLSSIQKKILPLPDNTTIYPGHGPATSVAREKQCNPFL